MSERYELRIGDRDEDGHHHAYITLSGWRNQFNKDGSEYFELSGICKPERAQAIVNAINSFARLKAENDELREALHESADYFERFSDADGDSEGFHPNEEMNLLTMCQRALGEVA